MNKNMRRTIRKISQHNDRVYCGYLTPAEFCRIVELGARPTYSNCLIKAWWYKEFGECTPSWYYFTLGRFGKTYNERK